MAGRRGHGEGSISQREDGRWHVRIDLGRGADGQRRRKSAYADTHADAVKLLRKLGGRADRGQLIATSTPTVGRYLDDWMRTHEDDWRPSTRRSYRAAIDGYLKPAFGPLRIEQVTPAQVQHWLTQHKTDHGARRRITLAHAVLRSALTAAQRLQLVTINAAALVSVPQPTARPIQPLDPEQAQAFLQAADGHRLHALFTVALACGLRLGEATGLRWTDIDIASGKVQIRQQLQRVGKRLVLQDLKTERSRRTLILPQVCLDALRQHRTHQLQERLKAGPAWTDSGLVFTTSAPRGDKRRRGGPLHPRNVLRDLHTILTAAGLPVRRFHDLRHSAASLLIAQGVPLVDVTMLLGHSDTRITANLYTHLLEQTAARAAQHMDVLLTAKK